MAPTADSTVSAAWSVVILMVASDLSLVGSALAYTVFQQ